jgi:hypothetical protein
MSPPGRGCSAMGWLNSDLSSVEVLIGESSRGCRRWATWFRSAVVCRWWSARARRQCRAGSEQLCAVVGVARRPAPRAVRRPGRGSGATTHRRPGLVRVPPVQPQRWFGDRLGEGALRGPDWGRGRRRFDHSRTKCSRTPPTVHDDCAECAKGEFRRGPLGRERSRVSGVSVPTRPRDG